MWPTAPKYITCRTILTAREKRHLKAHINKKKIHMHAQIYTYTRQRPAITHDHGDTHRMPLVVRLTAGHTHHSCGGFRTIMRNRHYYHAISTRSTVVQIGCEKILLLLVESTKPALPRAVTSSIIFFGAKT